MNHSEIIRSIAASGSLLLVVFGLYQFKAILKSWLRGPCKI